MATPALEEYIIPKKQRPSFLNALAPKVLEFVASKAKARKAINAGEILVNGRKATVDTKVQGGDVISYHSKKGTPSPKKATSKVFEEKLEVVFEDEHMAIINKPGGLPVNGNQFKTLENALPFNLKPTAEEDALDIMRPLHRLDGPTCGLVLSAKTERAQVVMGQQFEKKTIRKRYKAVVIGTLKESKGTIEDLVDDKPSKTEYEVIHSSKSSQYGTLSLVNLFPITGRTHQLRIHMSNLGHPVIGDKFYSKEHPVQEGKGLLLCSDKVWFNHPVTEKPIEVEINVPNKFRKYMERQAFVKPKK